jgi:hypothetical protein
LAQAVTTAFFDDLQHFITSKTPDDDVLQPLAAHGLTTLDIDEQFDSSGYHFRATSTGKLLRELFDNLRDDKAFNALLSH